MSRFEEPSGLARQEQSSLAALEAFRLLTQAFLASLEAGEFDYLGAAFAAELRSASACYAMARAIGDAGSEAAG